MAFYSAWIKIASRGELVLYMHFECGLISRIGHMHMCCGSSLTGELPSAVWPAGLVPHVFVCCGSSLTGELPSAVWPAGLVLHVFVRCGSSLTNRCECFANHIACSTCSFPTPFLESSQRLERR